MGECLPRLAITTPLRCSQRPARLAMLRSGTTSFYNIDGLGSVTSLTNGAGSLAQTVRLRFCHVLEHAGGDLESERAKEIS
jgi:hypothetical protein